jgi:hypothetical protein
MSYIWTILIRSNLIGQAGDSPMNLRATQLFSANSLPRRHLHERWSPEEHLGLAIHENGIVRQGRMIRSTGRGRAKHNGTRRLAMCRADGQVAEELADFVKHAKLLREKDSGLDSLRISNKKPGERDRMG